MMKPYRLPIVPSGRPLTSYRTIIELIAATTPETGLRIRAELDTEWYPTGVKITEAQMAGLRITPHQWRGDWNYTSPPLSIPRFSGHLR